MTTTSTKTIEAVTVLAGNIPQIAGEGYIQVVIKNADLFAGRTVFYPSRDNILYDASNGYKPIDRAGAQKLPDKLIKVYENLIDEAYSNYYHYRSKLQTGAGAGASAEEVEGLKLALVAQDNELKKLQAQNSQVEALKQEIERLKAQAPKGKIVHEKFNKIKNYVAEDEPIYLFGQAGTGKSHICKQIAEELGLEYYPEQQITQDFQLKGFIDAHGNYNDTQFYKAFTQGGLFFLDEMDASIPEALIILNGAIANRRFAFPNGSKEAHKDFRVISAGNTFGKGADDEYTGRNVLDASTLDRFAYTEIDYSPQVEELLANGNNELLDFIRDIRNTAKEIGISLIVSYRSISRITKMEKLEPLSEVLMESLVKGLALDDVALLVRNMNISSSNKYLKALKLNLK